MNLNKPDPAVYNRLRAECGVVLRADDTRSPEAARVRSPWLDSRAGDRGESRDSNHYFMIVSELIELLQKQPPSAEVEIVRNDGNAERTEDVVGVSPVDAHRTQVVRVQVVGASAI